MRECETLLVLFNKSRRQNRAEVPLRCFSIGFFSLFNGQRCPLSVTTHRACDVDVAVDAGCRTCCGVGSLDDIKAGEKTAHRGRRAAGRERSAGSSGERLVDVVLGARAESGADERRQATPDSAVQALSRARSASTPRFHVGSRIRSPFVSNTFCISFVFLFFSLNITFF
jgi:hypothetical protein